MHNAYFQYGKDTLTQQEYHLDGAVAEWLFASGFWTRINQKSRSCFDQYEEDIADVQTARIIQAELADALNTFGSISGTLEFDRGWQKDGTPLKVVLNRSLLYDQLRSLSDLFDIAIKANEAVTCDL